eukprot:jgi/Tetstr1/457510/TSEL_044091.t1
MIDFACVSSTTPTWSNDPRRCIPGIAATEAEHAKLAADRASSAPVQGVHRYYPFVVEDRGRLGKSALTVVYIFAVLLAETLVSPLAKNMKVTTEATRARKSCWYSGVGTDTMSSAFVTKRRYGHRRACVAAGGRRTRDEGVIWKGDPGDFYMKVIAKKFRGVWHYGVITGVVTEWVLEDYGGATQWRAVFEDGDIVDLLRSEVVEAMAAAQEHPPVDADGEARLVTVHQGDDLSRSGKVTVQSGWVMEDCLHHMETFSILNAGPLLEEARVKAIMTEKELRVPRRWTRSLGRGGLDTPRGAKARRPGQRGAKARRPGQRGAKARRPGQRGAKARRPGQRGAKARRPGQRGAKARRPGQRGAKARRPGQRGAKARRPGQRGAKARRPGQRGAKARRPGQRGAKARRPGQRGAKTAHTAESAERDALQAVDGSR